MRFFLHFNSEDHVLVLTYQFYHGILIFMAMEYIDYL